VKGIKNEAEKVLKEKFELVEKMSKNELKHESEVAQLQELISGRNLKVSGFENDVKDLKN
jgi:uncharacterized FlgJ-related protein